MINVGNKFRMNAEISLGDIPIPTETQDSVMKQVFQLSDGEIKGDKPDKANEKAEIEAAVEVTHEHAKPTIQSTPKMLKQVNADHIIFFRVSRF